jgi:hypothetical protein
MIIHIKQGTSCYRPGELVVLSYRHIVQEPRYILCEAFCLHARVTEVLFVYWMLQITHKKVLQKQHVRRELHEYI